MSNTDVASTILSQLGGNRFVAMTGSKNFVAGNQEEGSLSMKLARNSSKANHLRIILTALDTYKLEWIKITNPTVRNNFNSKIEVVKTEVNIYCDMLRDCFETETGMYTSL